MMNRIEREKIVISQMIAIYCRHHHSMEEHRLCPACSQLLAYAHRRLDHCPKGESKSSCRRCDIHCYAPMYKEQIRKVMKYVGPRMLLYHPWSAIRHLFDEFR